MTTKTTGSFNNNTTPPVDAQYLNIQRDEMNALCVIDGTTLDSSGLDNSQQAQAVKAYVSQAGILCTDSGSSANSYILTASSPFTNPPLKTGTRVRFNTANANTGSSTITPFGGSAITCKKSNGSTDLTTGDIPANTEVEFVYNGTYFVQSLSSSANNNALANLNGSANKIPYFNGVGSMALADLQPNRNAIINGDFNIWQRGTSFTSVAAAAYTADRWQYGKNGAMVHDITLSSDVPTVAQAGRLFSNSLKIDCQTVDSSIGSTEYSMLSHNIEGFNFRPLAQRAITLSFWVKATKTGTYCVSFRNGGADRSYVAEYTINASNTWEYKTITTLPSPASGTWDYTNSRGLSVDFALATGSTFQTTKDTWQTGNFLGTANQVNACDSTSNDFFITGVQLEAGLVSTPFEYRTIQQELNLCERYFEKSYNLTIAPATISYAGERAFSNQNSQANICPIGFKVKKRATPSVSLYSPNSGAQGKLWNGSADIDGTPNGIGEDGLFVGPSYSTTLCNLFFHFVANAEL